MYNKLYRITLDAKYSSRFPKKLVIQLSQDEYPPQQDYKILPIYQAKRPVGCHLPQVFSIFYI